MNCQFSSDTWITNVVITKCFFFSLQALKFLKEIMEMHNSHEDIFLSVVNGCFGNICDILMYCDDKSIVYHTAKDILLEICNSTALRDCTQAL